MSVANGQRHFLDLDSARAARAEVTRETFGFKLGGEEFAVLPTMDWPIEATALLAQGDLNQAIGLLLVGGSESEARLRQLGATMGDLKDLFDAVGEWSGVENLGNSLAPRPPASTPT